MRDDDNAAGALLSSRCSWPLLAYYAAHGLSPDSVLTRFGLSKAELRAPDQWLAPDVFLALFEEAARATRAPALGLHLARYVEPGTFDVLDYIAGASGTVRQALELVMRNVAIVAPGSTSQFVAQPPHMLWCFDFPPGWDRPPVAIEYVFSTLTSWGRRIVGVEAGADEVWFRHRRPAHHAAYAATFMCPVRFGAPYDAFLYRAEVLATPLPKRDPVLLQLLQRHADGLLANIPRTSTLHDQVRSVIERDLVRGLPTLAVVAARLGTSTGSLRRHLADHGTTYRDLADNVRFELAQRYLRDVGIPIGDLSHRLGFRCSTSFHKAFKRWTGTTPADFRRAKPSESRSGQYFGRAGERVVGGRTA